MTTDRLGVFEYLNVTESLSTIDSVRLEKIRSTYDDIIKNKSDKPLELLAQTLMLINDAENLNYLNICVTSSSAAIARQTLCGKYLEKQSADRRNARKTKQAEAAATAMNTVEPVSKVICQILIKEIESTVIDFIHHFLLAPLKQNQSNASTDNHIPRGSVLDVFIRHQLSARGNIIDVGRSLSKLPLIEPITLVDEFDTWYFDHLHGLFELNLLSDNSKTFPRRWQLTQDVQFLYRIDDLVADESTATRNIDRPSTVSLERFIEDVCEKENNGMATKWIDALRSDDIFTFDHLANLKHTEWHDLKVLSINGKKILKSYVDREKQLAADVKSTKKSSQSECQLLANVHKIKLYFHHILVEEFRKSNVPTPAKLDVRCVHSSFDEMRRDGFADDGLFDQMKMFFLPLTMVERDLSIDDSRWQSISNVRFQERDQLLNQQQKLVSELAEIEDEYYRHYDTVNKLKKETRPMKTTDDEYEKFSVWDLLDQHRDAMDQLDLKRNDLRTKIQTKEDLISDIEIGLVDKDGSNPSRTNRDLIKPNRGFIMYGPPGTGKSDIMSTLSTRIGISMVAPPIAAGELNRPLVGESERIISDICMRCHRVPYLMCCVSIDEIDSLTPKRKGDSSDGNVAKLSVLLSVIDGIKDVPNLMIFCATNRLHMMDEAFLRRMQGKFFVGRPSSLARKSILSGMKQWHLPPNLLENLTLATTNFSGAALRALRRLITVHCVDAERTNLRYQLDSRTMLQLADITARQYRILIGSETLPTLLLRTVDIAARFSDLSDKRNSIYTGKIIMNFSDHRIDIEAIHTDPKTTEIKKVVYQQAMIDTEINLQDLIERLTFYGKSRNVQLLQLIDLNLLSSESAYDEKDKFEVLKERLDECAAYRRSMIVYDLDSLVGINRSEGDSSMGRSTNLSLINPNIYSYIKDKFQNAHLERTTTTTEREKWSIMVIRDQFLLRQFCEDTRFTRSEREIEEERANNARAEEKIKCVQCNDYYIEEDNKMGVCVHHDGFVYDNHSLTLEQWGQRAAVEQLLKEEAQLLTSEQKEKLEHDKQRFKYICCNQTVQTSSTEGGCKKGKHSPASMTKNEWEYACDHNKEYQERRLNLLERRIQS